MNPSRLLVCLLLAGFLGLLPNASAVVRWRVSVKIFTDEVGNRPNNTTDADIQALVAAYNERLRSFYRGLELELTEVVQLDTSLH